MERFKNDFMLYLKSNQKLRKLYLKKEESEKEFWHNQYLVNEYLKNHSYEETKEHFKKEREENEKKQEEKNNIYEEIKKESLKNDLLLNNVLYNIIRMYDNFIINNMEKYSNKNIGEKTSEKIQEEIKAELLKNEIFAKSEIYIYFRGDYSNFEISFQIRKKEQERYIYNIQYKIQKKTSYNCYEEETKVFYYRYKASDFNYNYYSLDNLKYIEDTNKTVKEIIKQEEKQKKEIGQAKEKLKEKVKNYNTFINQYNLNGEHQKQFKIDTTLYLY